MGILGDGVYISLDLEETVDTECVDGSGGVLGGVNVAEFGILGGTYGAISGECRKSSETNLLDDRSREGRDGQKYLVDGGVKNGQESFQIVLHGWGGCRSGGCCGGDRRKA